MISSRLSNYFKKKGYSALPRESVEYATKVVGEILKQRRNHQERRNDFIQIMVDNEETVKQEGSSESYKRSKSHGMT